MTRQILVFVYSLIAAGLSLGQAADDSTVRVFIFAGQSNMVGSDSKVKDIKNFPLYAGLEQPQEGVRFSYSIGRENKTNSDGWVALEPVNNTVGPELSFARRVTQAIDAPVARRRGSMGRSVRLSRLVLLPG